MVASDREHDGKHDGLWSAWKRHPLLRCSLPRLYLWAQSASLGWISGVELQGRGTRVVATSLHICKLLTYNGLANRVLPDSEICHSDGWENVSFFLFQFAFSPIPPLLSIFSSCYCYSPWLLFIANLYALVNGPCKVLKHFFPLISLSLPNWLVGFLSPKQ